MKRRTPLFPGREKKTAFFRKQWRRPMPGLTEDAVFDAAFFRVAEIIAPND